MDIRLIWLALGAFAIGAEGFVISSLLPEIAGDTGVSVTQAGYLVLAYALAYAVGAPVLSTLIGTADRRNVLSITALVFAAGASLAALADGYGVLLAARVIMAFAAGLYAATAQATAVGISEPHHRARAVSVIVGGTTLAVALGAPIGALVAGFAGWRGTYFGIAALGIIAAVAIRLLLPAGLRGEKRSLKERLAVVALPGVWPTLLTTLLYMTGPFAVFIYVAPLAVGAVGLGRDMLPAVLLGFGIGAAIGNYIGGQMADRVGAHRTTMLALALSVVMLVLLSVIPHLPAGLAGPVFIAFMVPWGVVGWGFLPAQVSKLVGLVPNAGPLVLSLNGSALYLGTALGAVVGGLVLEHATAFELGWVGALFPLAGLALQLWAQMPKKEVFARLG